MVEAEPRDGTAQYDGDSEVVRLATRHTKKPLWQSGNRDDTTAVVFLHGVPGPSSLWRPLMGRIGSFARTVAPDLPGFGDAVAPRNFRYDLASYADYLNDLVDELDIRTVHLVLHDFAGPWGLTWAAGNPNRFASVALINTGVWLNYRWPLAARLYRAPLIGELSFATATYGSFALVTRLGSRRPLLDADLRSIWDSMTTRTRHSILRVYRAESDPAAVANTLADKLRPLGRPALVIWGGTDSNMPTALAERQREAFPGAHVHVLSDSGHYPHLDNLEKVGSLLVPFLRAQTNA